MSKPDVPEDTTVDFSLEFVWKATSFDRMNTALKLFRDYSASISGYLFHVLLGHEVRGASGCVTVHACLQCEGRACLAVPLPVWWCARAGAGHTAAAAPAC
jgi:hypothetical protein